MSKQLDAEGERTKAKLPDPPVAVPIDPSQFRKRGSGQSPGSSQSPSSYARSPGSSHLQSPGSSHGSSQNPGSSHSPGHSPGSSRPRSPGHGRSPGGGPSPGWSQGTATAAVTIKEEPVDEPAAFGDFDLAIACVAGNAEDQWGLHSTLDLDAEVKTEQYYDDYESEDDPDLGVDAGVGYSSLDESNRCPEPEAHEGLRVSPEVELLQTPQRVFEVVDLEAEWAERDAPSPRVDEGRGESEHRVVVKEEPSPCPSPEASRSPVALVPVKSEQPRAPTPPPTRVKKERGVVDEEAGRAQLFGQQDFPDDAEGELVLAEDKQGDDDDGCAHTRSTTLYPAVSTEMLDEMKAHVAMIVHGYMAKAKDLRTVSSDSATPAVAHRDRGRRSHSPVQDDAVPKRLKQDADVSPQPCGAEDVKDLKDVKKKTVPAALAPAPASVKKRRLEGLKAELKEEPLDEPLSPPPPKSKKAFAGPASAKHRRKLPVLPACQHAGLSPIYDGRSPLFVEDEAPRKSYSVGPAESLEGKSCVRASSRPSWLDDVLYYFSKWKPEWLTEAKRVSAKKVPNLLPDMERYDAATSAVQFESVDEYLHHFQHGLLLELWEMLRKESKPSKPIITAVETHHDKPLLGNKRRRLLVCHCGTDFKISPLRAGDLVVVRSVKNSSEPAIKPHFAYVEGVNPKKVVSDSVKLSIHLQDHYETEPCFKYGYKVTVCTDDIPETVPKVLLLTKLRNVYEEVELFKILSDFAPHNMAPLVLQPKHSVRPEPAFGLKTGADLHQLSQKPVVQSIIQDIVDYEAPSLSVVEGGPGTGKTHLVAALAQELVERKHKLNRDCYVIIAAKSNNQLDIILEKLHARHSILNKDPKNRDPDAFRAVWLGNDRRGAGELEGLKRNSLRKLAERHMLKQNSKPLEKDRKQLSRDIAKNESKLNKLSKKNFLFPELASNTAKMKLQLTLLNEKIEKNLSQAKDENYSINTILEKCDILLTTFSCYFYRKHAQDALLKSKPRKHVVLIVDDASEIIEPTIIKMIVLFNVTDVVLFGDARQHTPYVSSKWARNAGLVVPLMKRYSQALKEAHCLPMYRSLSRQVRLHPDVLRGLNKTFYEEAMKPSNEFKKYLAEGPHCLLRPYVWFNCTYLSGENKFKDEAEFVIKLLSALFSCTSEERDSSKRRVSVISFCKEIRSRIETTEYAQYCDVADNISSMEYDIVILSLGPFTRIRVDKTICALTRARKCLFICGNTQDLSPKFLALFKDARELKCTEDITDSGITEKDLVKRILK